MRRLLILTLIFFLSCSSFSVIDEEADCDYKLFEIPEFNIILKYECDEGRCVPNDIINLQKLNDLVIEQANCELEIWKQFGQHPCCFPFDGINKVIVLDPSCQPSGEWYEDGELHIKVYSCTDNKWWTEEAVLTNILHAFGLCWTGDDYSAWRCIK